MSRDLNRMESILAPNPYEFSCGSVDVRNKNEHKCSDEMENLFHLISSDLKSLTGSCI
jgi:hypothetical protein